MKDMRELDLSQGPADDTRPLEPKGGYVHRARLDCVACKGSGRIEGATCFRCGGTGSYMVGCGGSVRRDDYWSFASCEGCGGAIPIRETRPEKEAHDVV